MAKTPKTDFRFLDNIPCNTEVHFQIITPTQPIRLRSRLIGVDPGKSIIIAFGSDRIWHSATPFITDRRGVVVRVVNSAEHDASIVAFKSHIQRLVSVIGKWIIIDYPKDLQSMSLRTHSRIPVNIKSSLNSKTDDATVWSQGFLKDISLTGAAFKGAETSELKVDEEYLLKVELENESLKMPVTLKKIQKDEVRSELAHHGLVINAEPKELEEFAHKVISYHLLQKQGTKTAES